MRDFVRFRARAEKFLLLLRIRTRLFGKQRSLGTSVVVRIVGEETIKITRISGSRL